MEGCIADLELRNALHLRFELLCERRGYHDRVLRWCHAAVVRDARCTAEAQERVREVRVHVNVFERFEELVVAGLLFGVEPFVLVSDIGAEDLEVSAIHGLQVLLIWRGG